MWALLIIGVPITILVLFLWSSPAEDWNDPSSRGFCAIIISIVPFVLFGALSSAIGTYDKVESVTVLETLPVDNDPLVVINGDGSATYSTGSGLLEISTLRPKSFEIVEGEGEGEITTYRTGCSTWLHEWVVCSSNRYVIEVPSDRVEVKLW